DKAIKAERVCDFSRDGRFLAYMLPDPDWHLWVMELSGASAPVPFRRTRFAEGFGQFSPDGRWLAYLSDESGKRELYVAPFPGPAARVRLSSGGADAPRWSRDGKELFYFSARRKLMAVDVRGLSRSEPGTPRTVLELRYAQDLSQGQVSKWGFDVSAD